jgi:hypothetical protein
MRHGRVDGCSMPVCICWTASCSMTTERRSASWMTSNCQALSSVLSPPVRDRPG